MLWINGPYGGGWNNIVSGVIFAFVLSQGISPAFAGAITGIGRIFDAIFSLFFGSITDEFYKTKLGKRFGRRHFFILLGGILFAVLFPLFWVQSDDWRYYLIIYIAIEIVIAMILIPWETLPTEMTNDYKLRTVLSGSRMFISATGTAIVFAVLAILKHMQNQYVSEGTRDRAETLLNVIQTIENKPDSIAVLEANKDYLVKQSQWIIGGDGWAYDIGYGGFDHVMAQGFDINALVLDNEEYANTGGQASKSTPFAAIAKFAAGGKMTKKKDLGLMFMSYGYIYVAQIAMGADKAQTIKALAEAEAYPGPSVVIAYCPCINHGIKTGMSHSQEEQKMAVECGYWSLYRYNPLLMEEGKNPFIMDSKPPKGDFCDYLMNEVRFASLMKVKPDEAEGLYKKTESDAMNRIRYYQKMAER